MNWQRATGGTFDGTKYLDQKNADIREIATQPMLLYLLARMHEDGEPVPANLNQEVGGIRFQVYRRILDWVCERQSGKGVSQDDSSRIRRFLQVAGLTTHQSGQRVLHWDYLQQALLDCGLATEPQEQQTKSYSTILSFAFTSKDHKSWEFTHKSFGEALAAESVDRLLEDLSEEGKHGEEWRVAIPEATRAWLGVCGPQFLTKEILDFCEGWFAQKTEDFQSRTIQRLLGLFASILGGPAASSATDVATRWGRPLISVMANAARSLFSVTNLVIGTWLRSSSRSEDPLQDFESLIQPLRISEEIFRQGALLCHLASPIRRGDYPNLFLYSRRAVSFVSGGERRAPYTANYVADLFYIKQKYGTRRAIRHHQLVLGDGVIMPRSIREASVIRSQYVLVEEDRQIQAPFERAALDLEATIQAGFEDSPLNELREVLGSFPERKIPDEIREKVDKWVAARLEGLIVEKRLPVGFRGVQWESLTDNIVDSVIFEGERLVGS